MPLKKIIALFILFLMIVPAYCVAQTKRVDSFKTQAKLATTEQAKLMALLEVCKEQSSISPDTLYRYARSAKELALAQKDAASVAAASYYIAVHYQARLITDSCIAVADECLKQLHYSAAEKEMYANFILLKARSLNSITKSKDALALIYPLLTEAEKKEDTLIQAKAINGLAAALVSTGDNKQALQWCNKAIKLYPQPLPAVYQEAFGITLNNTGLIYLHLYQDSGIKKLLDSAEFYTGKALTVNTQSGFLGSIAYTLGLRGTILGFNNKPEAGEKLLLESLATYRRIGNTFYIINSLAVLGNFYGITKQPQKGIAVCKEGIVLCDPARPNIFLYSNLAGNYKQAGEYRLYGETLERLSAIKDSLHQKNSAEALSELQTRYETQKKENTIIQQNYALAKKNYLAYGSLALMLIGGIFSILLIRLNRNRQEFKFQTMQREEKRLHEIAVSTAEEKERRRIAAELHDNLGGQLSYISSNMDFILEAPALLSEEEKKKQLSKINDTAKSTIADLRESIWALKKQQVEIDELADKIKLYAQNQLSHQADMQLEVHENILQNSILSSAEALNIFRICQEAIQNALKHSGADKVVLSIETDKTMLCNIAIADNGKGFNTKEYFTDHYGLENMQQRSADIHALLNINSTCSGTIVRLIKQLHPANELNSIIK